MSVAASTSMASSSPSQSVAASICWSKKLATRSPTWSGGVRASMSNSSSIAICGVNCNSGTQSHSQMHKCSIAQMHKCQMLQCSNAPPMLKCTNANCSNAQMHKCQLSNAECANVPHAHMEKCKSGALQTTTTTTTTAPNAQPSNKRIHSNALHLSSVTTNTNGKCTNGKWQMENGKWQMHKCTNARMHKCQLPTATITTATIKQKNSF